MARKKTQASTALNLGTRKKLETEEERVLRENVNYFIGLDPRTKADIAKAAGIDASRFTRLTRGKNSFTVVEVFSVSKALDVPVRTLVSIKGGSFKWRDVPLLQLSKFPTEPPADEAMDELIRFRHRWDETNNPDQKAYLVDILEAFGDALPGDIGLFSASEPPKPKEMMVVVVDKAASLASCVMLGDKIGASLPSGQVRTDFDYWGRRLELIRK